MKITSPKFLDWIIALLGVWLVLSPWLLGYGGVTSALVISEVVGAIFIVFGALAGLTNNNALATVLDWFLTLISFWFILAPYLLLYFNQSKAAEVNTIIVGLVVFVLAIWAALATSISANRISKENYRKSSPIPVTGSDNDTNLQHQIVDRLNQDQRVNASDVNVNVRNGQVTLNGTVTTDEEKAAAKEDAKQVSGVKDVDNDLEVAT